MHIGTELAQRLKRTAYKLLKNGLPHPLTRINIPFLNVRTVFS